MTKVPCLKTAGELKRALESIPDDTPLVIADHGPGWGLKPPFIAEYSWITYDHNGYVTNDEAQVMRKSPTKARPEKLPKPVCVIEPGL